MTAEIRFPAMRAEVIGALESLSDRSYQERQWGRYDPDVEYFDDFTLNVHILYDDCCVLPDPETRVGTVVFSSEVDVLRALDSVLGPMLKELGNSPDSTYMEDPRWNDVIEAAKAALAVMKPS